MTPERWKQIDELVQAVLDRAPEDRAVFLDQVCADDEALRRDVELLISFDPQASGFLERPAFDHEVHANTNPAFDSNPAVLRIFENYLAERQPSSHPGNDAL